MAVGFGAVGSGIGQIGAAAGDLFSAAGAGAAAAQFGKAATLAKQNAQQETAAYKLQQVQTARTVYQTIGTGIADAAGNGGMMTGSAAAIARSSAQQGALATQLIGTEGQINVNSYLAQQQADLAQQAEAEAQQRADEAGAVGGFIGGAVSIASAFI